MRTLTACFLTLGLGLSAPPAVATAYNGVEADPKVRAGTPSPEARMRQATFVRKHNPVPKQTRAIDLDGDGAVSQEEARAYYAWLFKLLDRNGDGAITKLEFIKALGPGRMQISLSERTTKIERLGVLFSRLDKDGDEQIDGAEFMGACDNHFASADANGDGIVTLEEFGSRQAL